MHAEVWKWINGYEGLYEISNCGRVKSLKYDHILTPYKYNGGYLRVQLYKNKTMKRMYIHRLVANAFIPNEDNKLEVNHIDGDKTNNSASNLEWVNHKENMRHAKNTGLLKPIMNYGKTTHQLTCECDVINVFKNVQEASKKTGINASSIYACCKRTHKNCWWI